MNRALAGVTVVDLTRVLAGPYATMVLADLGADVIKIEPPGGDGTRRLQPALDATRSSYFAATNRGKRSVVLDLKTDAGRALLLELLARADVLVENFRPGVLDRLVLPDDELRARFPRLVVCSLSAFGAAGPDRDEPAFDLTIQARGGGMGVTGHPGEPPVRMGFPMGDLAGALFAVCGVLAALVARGRDGEGDHLDLALLDGQAALLSYFAQYHLDHGITSGPVGSGHPSAVPYRVFPTAEGHLAVAVFTDRFWPPFARALGRDDWAGDPELAASPGRIARRDELEREIEAALAGATAAEWHRRFRAAGVPVAPVQAVDAVLADPQLAARDVVLRVPDEDGRPRPVVASPLRSLRRPAAHTARRAAPALGADTEAVLAELLDLPPERVAALRAAGALG